VWKPVVRALKENQKKLLSEIYLSPILHTLLQSKFLFVVG